MMMQSDDDERPLLDHQHPHQQCNVTHIGPSSTSTTTILRPTAAAALSINTATATQAGPPPTASAGAAATSASASIRPRRRTFTIGNLRVRCSRARIIDAILDCLNCFVEGLIYLIGPLLIVLALSIISMMTYTFFTVMLPMMQLKHAESPYKDLYLVLHCCFVCFLLFHILFNYFLCVRTRHHGPHYDRVVRELAAATNFVYPETPTQVAQYRREFEDRMVLRMRRREARAAQQMAAITASAASTTSSSALSSSSAAAASSSSSTTLATASALTATSPLLTTTAGTIAVSDSNAATSTSSNGSVLHRRPTSSLTMVGAVTNNPATTSVPSPPRVRLWMMMGPYEWGYCGHSHQPKPPRSHYDHVSKKLILNLDHYCPWMFNAIGYFNYRYFVNFLLYILIGMTYGIIVTAEPFWLLSTQEYRDMVRTERRTGHRPTRVKPMIPYHSEKTLISLSFMMSAAVGLAILGMASFHVYLIVTAQTTIEFHANWGHRKRAKRAGIRWKNPYSMGGYLGNWQQLYGRKYPWWMAPLIPNWNEPENLPVPIPGHPRRDVRTSRVIINQGDQDTKNSADDEMLSPV